jgi:hypothetical protein
MAIRFIPIDQPEKRTPMPEKSKPKVVVATQPGVEVHTQRLGTAREALKQVDPSGGCSDPNCQYRPIVEEQRAKAAAARERTRLRVQKYRKKP